MVEELEVKKIPLKLIKFDETNPNILSKNQMDSLKLTMKKFGYLAPVILNKDFTVIDGEHRVKIYQELGKKEIQAYVLDVDTIDLKILRQLMNKLRGEHDPLKDKLEFSKIFESGRFNEFTDLLSLNMSDFDKVLSPPVVDSNRQSDRLDVSADYYLNGTIKQIILFLNNDEYQSVLPNLEKYMKLLTIDNHTDLFMKFYKEYERNNP